MNFIILVLGLLISATIGFILGRKSIKKETIQITINDDLLGIKDFTITAEGYPLDENGNRIIQEQTNGN